MAVVYSNLQQTAANLRTLEDSKVLKQTQANEQSRACEMDGDYYSAVYAWFDKCGIISNVRTHLRQNLVNALKSKDTTLNKDKSTPKCARQYVYDLLVAEYLSNYNYAYTLSVFASEAPMLVNFWKNFESSHECNEQPGRKQKLQNDYVRHSLETLGIKPEDPTGLSIVNEYAATRDTPLLLCILKCAALSLANENSNGAQRHEHKSVQQDCEIQMDNAYRSASSEISKLTSAKRKLYRQKEMFESQLKQKENELIRRATLVERQATVLNEKLAKARNLMDRVNLKEKELNEEKMREDRRIYRREIELSTKEDLLSREADRLEKERDSYRKFEGDLKKLRDELTKAKKDLPSGEANDDAMSCRDVQVQTDLFGSEKLIIKRERAELSSLVKVQQSRIEQLTRRSVSLSRQLEEAQLLKRRSSIETNTAAPNTVLSESSSTEDILQDAKLRLRRLEEENLKADQCYFNCIASASATPSALLAFTCT